MKLLFILFFLFIGCSERNQSHRESKSTVEIGFELSEKDKNTFELEGIKPAFIGLRVERSGEQPQVLNLKAGEETEVEVLTGKNIFKAALVLYRESDNSKLYYSKVTQEVDVGRSTQVLNFEFPQVIESAKTNVYGVAYLNDSVPASQYDLQVMEPHTGAAITLPDFAHLAKTDMRGVFAFQYFFDRPEIPNVQLKFASNSKTYDVVKSFTSTQQGFSSLGFINLEGTAATSPFLISPDLLRGEPGAKGDKGDAGSNGTNGTGFIVRANDGPKTVIGQLIASTFNGWLVFSENLSGLGSGFFSIASSPTNSSVVGVSNLGGKHLYSQPGCSGTPLLLLDEKVHLPYIYSVDGSTIYKTSESITPIFGSSAFDFDRATCANEATAHITFANDPNPSKKKRQFSNAPLMPAPVISEPAVVSNGGVQLLATVTHKGIPYEGGTNNAQSLLTVALCSVANNCSNATSWVSSVDIDVSHNVTDFHKLGRIASQPAVLGGRLYLVLHYNYYFSTTYFYKPLLFSCQIQANLQCNSPSLTQINTGTFSSWDFQTSKLTSYLVVQGSIMHILLLRTSAPQLTYASCDSTTCQSPITTSDVLSVNSFQKERRLPGYLESADNFAFVVGNYLVLPFNDNGYLNFAYCNPSNMDCSSTWTRINSSPSSTTEASMDPSSRVAVDIRSSNEFVLAFKNGSGNLATFVCTFTSSMDCTHDNSNFNEANVGSLGTFSYLSTVIHPTSSDIAYAGSNSSNAGILPWDSTLLRYDAPTLSTLFETEFESELYSSRIVSYTPDFAPTQTNYFTIGKCLGFDETICTGDDLVSRIAGAIAGFGVSTSVVSGSNVTWAGPAFISKQ